MNNTCKTTYQLLSIYLLSPLLFQGCATYPPVHPAHYPPSTAVLVPSHKQFPEQKRPESAIFPAKQTPRQTGKIVGEFSRQATDQIGQGRLDVAVTTLERGLRLAPKDATLWSQLAEVKLQQQQYRQASSLASKSNSMAGNNAALIQKNYWIVEEARRRSEDY